MTAHQSVVARLLASFEDEREIGTLPIEKIRADLGLMGVDPTASIRLAEGLAATPRPPVASLLAQIETSEATADLKPANVSSVHARFRSKDRGSPAPAPAPAAKPAPDLSKSRRPELDGNWTINSVANGAYGQRSPTAEKSKAAARDGAFDLERPGYSSHHRMPRSKLKVAPGASRIRMTAAACVSLLCIGGAWIYSREHAEPDQVTADAASSVARTAQPGAADIREALAEPQVREVRMEIPGDQPPLVRAPAIATKLLPGDASPRDGTEGEVYGTVSDAPPINPPEQLLPRRELPTSTSAQTAETASPVALSHDSKDSTAASLAPERAIEHRSAAGPEAEPPTKQRPTPAEITVVAAIAPGSSDLAAPGGGYRIQLAAVRAEGDGRRAWDLLQANLGPLLSGMQPFLERAETANGIFYRVQIGPFAKLEDAESRCDEIRRRGSASCFVIRR